MSTEQWGFGQSFEELAAVEVHYCQAERLPFVQEEGLH
jgi:hypothetical protein